MGKALSQMLSGEEKRAAVHLRMLRAHIVEVEALLAKRDALGVGPCQSLAQCASDLAMTLSRVDALRLAIDRTSGDNLARDKVAHHDTDVIVDSVDIEKSQ
jgi:hypothetical protein